MSLKKTVLYDIHESMGAKLSPFAGYLMPIQYRGIIAEHIATRTRATVFDTCHMGEFHIDGESACDSLENILTCMVGDMKIGQCRYGLMCNHEGGVVDDQIIYRLGENEFLMVVNAGTRMTDLQWISSHLSTTTRLEDVSDGTAKIDIQGPLSPGIIRKLMDERIDDLLFFHFKKNRYKGKRVLVSRTGYTGEMGFEVYCSNDAAVSLWNDCMELGAEPAGLGARDTLRLEMGFPLYGNELFSHMNAAESGLLGYMAKDKTFVGSQVVLDETRREFLLVAMVLRDRRAARPCDTILDVQGNECGFITSGSFSPSLGRAIALGYIHRSISSPGTEVMIRTKRNELKATICQAPLYKGSTARMDLNEFLGEELFDAPLGYAKEI